MHLYPRVWTLEEKERRKDMNGVTGGDLRGLRRQSRALTLPLRRLTLPSLSPVCTYIRPISTESRENEDTKKASH